MGFEVIVIVRHSATGGGVRVVGMFFIAEREIREVGGIANITKKEKEKLWIGLDGWTLMMSDNAEVASLPPGEEKKEICDSTY